MHSRNPAERFESCGSRNSHGGRQKVLPAKEEAGSPPDRLHRVRTDLGRVPPAPASERRTVRTPPPRPETPSGAGSSSARSKVPAHTSRYDPPDFAYPKPSYTTRLGGPHRRRCSGQHKVSARFVARRQLGRCRLKILRTCCGRALPLRRPSAVTGMGEWLNAGQLQDVRALRVDRSASLRAPGAAGPRWKPKVTAGRSVKKPIAQS